MKTNYDKIKDYLSQKGYEGQDLEAGARKAAVQIEAIQAGLDPVQSKPVPAAMDAGRMVSDYCPACGMLRSQCDCWDPVNQP